MGLCYNLWYENRGKKICKRSGTFSPAYATEPGYVFPDKMFYKYLIDMNQ